MVQLYQLNIAHRLFHLADWKFCYLNFRARNRRRLKKWKFFFDSLYNYDYIEVNDEENSEEEEAAIVSEKPANHTTAGQSKLVSYTDCSSEEEDLHVVIVFDEPIDLAIN